MNTTQRYLAGIGFTEKEEKVYLALLQIGPTTTGPLAKETGVSRSKLYEVLEKLSRRGIVGHFKRNNISHFRAAPPTRIINYIEEKERELEVQKKELTKRLPFFEGILQKSRTIMDAEVFEGREGIKNIREWALTTMMEGDEMLFFGNPASGHEKMLKYWDDWNKRRIKKKIITKTVYNQDAKKYGERRKILPYTYVKFLPFPGPSHAWIEIYGDVIAIAMEYKTPMSIVIRNPFVAESFRTYQKMFWELGLDSF